MSIDIDGIIYSYESVTNTASVTGYSDYSTNSRIIPNNIIVGFDSFQVISIEYLALNGALWVSITVPDSVITIGDNAFETCFAVSITLGVNVTTIGEYAFLNCPALASVTFNGNNLLTIGDYAFYYCTALTSINIPTSVTSIGNESFLNCTDLASVTFNGNNLLTIGNSAFYNCTALTSIILPESVTSIGTSAFYNCTALASVTFNGNNLLTISGGVFSTCSALTSIILPESVTTIGDYAFADCTALTSIILLESVTYIGTYAFANCSALDNVYFNHTTTLPSLGFGVFEAHPSNNTGWYYSTVTNPSFTLSSSDFAYLNVIDQIYGLTYRYDNSVFDTSAVLIACDQTNVNIVILAAMDVTHPVTLIAASFFNGFTTLLSATIPDSVLTIGNDAFGGCTALADVYFNHTTTLPVLGTGVFTGHPSNNTAWYYSTVTDPSVTLLSSDFAYLNVIDQTYGLTYRYDNSVFDSSAGLILCDQTNTAVVILDVVDVTHPVTLIDASVFNGFTTLLSATIPASILTIGDTAFASCSALDNVYFNHTTTLPALGTDVFLGHPSNNTAWYYSTVTDPSMTLLATDFAYLNVSDQTYGLTYRYDNSVFNSSAALIACDQTNVNVVILAVVDVTHPVTLIEAYVFDGFTTLLTATIPGSVITISSNAFSNCSALMSILLPESLLTIGNEAFASCYALTSIILPESVTSIGAFAFVSCSVLASLTFLGNNLLTIDNNAFNSCVALTSIILPASVTTIDAYVFSNCSSLASVTFLGNNLLTIGNNAFESCSALTSIILPESVTTIDAYVFSNCSSLASVTLGVNVTTIGNNAFNTCIALTSIILPESVTSIGNDAFNTCIALTSIILPESVTSIGDNAFASCSALADVYFNHTTTLPVLGTDVFLGHPINNTAWYYSTVTAPSLTLLSSDFAYLNVIDQAYGLTYRYDNSVFDTSAALIACDQTNTAVVILAVLDVTHPVTLIGASVFNGFTTLLSATIPASILTIGNDAFGGCSALDNVYFNHTITLPALGTDVFLGHPINNTAWYYSTVTDPSLTLLSTDFAYLNVIDQVYGLTYRYDNSVFDSSAALIACDQTNTAVVILAVVDVTHPVTLIGASVFQDFTTLLTATIPASILTIGENAFDYCFALNSVNIPNSVITISNSAFINCYALTIIDDTIPASVITIGDYAFGGCVSFINIILGVNVTTIGNSAFSDCYALASVTFLGNNVLTIGDQAFAYCSVLTSITIPNSVTTIGMLAFPNCFLLASVTFEANSNLIAINTSTFANCTALTTIDIPKSVITIGDYVFENCTALTSVTFEANSNLTTIDFGAFISCTALTSILLPATVLTINYNAFSNCSALTSIILPASILTIGDNAFISCTALTDVYFNHTTTLPALGNSVFIGHPSNNTAWYYSTVTAPSLTLLSTEFAYLNVIVQTYGLTYRYDNSVFDSSAGLILCDQTNTALVILAVVDVTHPVTLINASVFNGFTTLLSATIPASILTIGDDAFASCSALTDVYFNHTTTLPVLGTNVFLGHPSNNTAWYYSTVTDPSLTLLSTDFAYLNVIDQTYGLTYRYDNSVFDSSAGLILCDQTNTAVVILAVVDVTHPVTLIGASVFNGFTTLLSATIPASILTIGDTAFASCSALTDVYFNHTTTLPVLGTNVFLGHPSNNTAWYYSTVTDPSLTLLSTDFAYLNVIDQTYGLTYRYDNSVFDSSAALIACDETNVNVVILAVVDVTHPVTLIAGYVFQDFMTLLTVTIPDSVLTIGNNAFDFCTALNTVIFGNSVSTIGSLAFTNCYALTNLILPDSVLTIGNDAFYECENLINIILGNNVLSIGNRAFGRTALTNIILPDSVLTIGDQAFSDCSALQNVIIGNGIEIIPTRAFHNCVSLINVIFGENVTTIYDSFQNCTSLQNIIIPNNVTTISGSFTNCSSLTYVILGLNLLNIGADTFSACTSLNGIILPDNITTIGNNAFYGCLVLNTVSLGSGLTSIGISAFQGCIDLSNVYFYQNTIPLLGNNAFELVPNNNTAWYLYGANNTNYLPPYFTFLKLINPPPPPPPPPLTLPKCPCPVFKNKNIWFGGNMNNSSKTSAMRYSQLVRGRGPNYGSNAYVYNEVNAFGYYVQGGPGGSGAPPRNSF